VEWAREIEMEEVVSAAEENMKSVRCIRLLHTLYSRKRLKY